jgi:hypothetical protein
MKTIFFLNNKSFATPIIDLSHNALTSVKSLSNLQCLKSICLDNNHLSNLDGLQHCCHLCELSVKVNGKIIITELEIGDLSCTGSI